MKKALITGAGGGVGQALALLLKKKGYLLLPLGKQEADLSTEEGRGKVIALLCAERPALVINNAGLGFYGKTSSLEASQMVAVNVEAVTQITLAAVEMWVERGEKGIVMNISSAAGEIPTPGMALYGATKAFVTSFSKALDYEYAPRGVRILVSQPGQIATPFARKAARREIAETRSMLPALAAKKIIWQIERGRGAYLFGVGDRVALFFTKRLCLERLAMKLVHRSIGKRL